MRVSQRNAAGEWADRACAELGLGPGELDKEAVFALAEYVARDVGGAAVPLASVLLGIAIGRGMSLAEATSRLSTVVEQWRGVDWRD